MLNTLSSTIIILAHSHYPLGSPVTVLLSGTMQLLEISPTKLVDDSLEMYLSLLLV
jgi:hypothetical protein